MRIFTVLVLLLSAVGASVQINNPSSSGITSQTLLGKSAVIATDPQYAGGVKADAIYVLDATWATAGAGPSTVTAPDGNFVVNAKVGQICYGILANANQLVQGTITVITSSTSITCSGARTGGGAAGNGLLVWGSDDTAAIAAAYAALIAPPNCASMILPAGYMLVQSSVMNSTPAACQSLNGDGVGVDVYGQGEHSTFLVPTPNFDFTTCGGAGTGCFVSGSSTISHDFQIFGAGFNTNPALQHFAIAFSGASFGERLAVTQWNETQANFTAFSFNNQQNACILCFSDASGGQSVQSFGIVVLDNYSKNGAGTTSSGRLTDLGGTYGAGPGPAYTNGGDSVNVGIDVENTTNSQFGYLNNGFAHIFGGRLIDTLGTSAGLGMGGTSQAYLSGGVAISGSATSGAINANTCTSCVIHDDGTTVYTGPTSNYVGQSNATFLVGHEKAAVNLTGQTGNIGATTFPLGGAVPSNNPYGSYRMTYDLVIVTAGTSGTMVVNLICTNSVGAFTQPGPTTVLVTATAGTEISGTLACMPAVSTNIQYSVTGVGTAGALSYKLNLRLEAI